MLKRRVFSIESKPSNVDIQCTIDSKAMAQYEPSKRHDELEDRLVDWGDEEIQPEEVESSQKPAPKREFADSHVPVNLADDVEGTRTRKPIVLKKKTGRLGTTMKPVIVVSTVGFLT